jgi:hypothetical protein
VFIECFKGQTAEVRAAFVDGICTILCDAIAKAPDEYWQMCGCNLYMLDLPETLQRPQRPLVDEVLVPELNRRLIDNPSDVRAARTIRAIGIGSATESDEIRKDQFILRSIISARLYNLSYVLHEIRYGGFYEPEEIDRGVVGTRNCLDQLESSTLKDKWNEQLLEYERLAVYWDDYCRTHLLYADFQQYMTLYGFEW